jgi:hypothetical protein
VAGHKDLSHGSDMMDGAGIDASSAWAVAAWPEFGHNPAGIDVFRSQRRPN